MAFKNPGVQALFVTNLFSNVLRLGSNLILARMLSPEAFAITGLAMTVIFTFNMISDGGFKAFILRHQQGEADKLISTLWTVKLLRNILLAVALFLTSDVIAAFFGIVEMSLVLKVLCLNFLFDGIKPMTDLLAERQNKVATVMYLHFACYVLSTMVTLVGVYFYQSYWAIIVGMIANMAFMALAGYVFLGSKGAYLHLDRKILIEFLHWAKFIIPSSIITLLLMQLDKIILGKALSVVELGLYYVAFNFSSAAMTICIEYARKVLLPQMAKIYRESPDRYKFVYYQSKMKVLMLLAFLIGLLSGVSFVFFDILYDQRYIQSSFFLSILLLMPILALLTYPAEASLIIHGFVRMTLIANLIRLGWFLISAYVGFHYFGVVGLLLAIGFIELLPAVYMLFRMYQINLLNLVKELLILFVSIIGFAAGKMLTFFYTV